MPVPPPRRRPSRAGPHIQSSSNFLHLDVKQLPVAASFRTFRFLWLRGSFFYFHGMELFQISSFLFVLFFYLFLEMLGWASCGGSSVSSLLIRWQWQWYYLWALPQRLLPILRLADFRRLNTNIQDEIITAHLFCHSIMKQILHW